MLSDPSPSADFVPGEIVTILCDLDGVVWLSHDAIPGAVAAIAGLRDSGRRVLFVTNNSVSRRTEHEAALADIGISAHGDVLSSAMAAARLVQPGERVLVTGGQGLVEAVEERGAVALPNDGRQVGAVDVVVVGLDRHFDYGRLTSAAAALHAGARLIGTNTDPTYPTPRGLEPGGGAILAAVATAGGTEPVIAGKPHRAMADLVVERLGGSAFAPRTALMVGDRPDTDGLMAQEVGCGFVLVRSGVTAHGDDVGPFRPVLDLEDFAALPAHLNPS